jgi:glycosyltransferase involved in cell wall biosynthesis
MLAEIRRRLRAGGVRAVHWNHLDAAQYVEHLGPDQGPGRGSGRGSVPTVFDTHNLLTRMYERFAQTAGNPVRKGYAALQWWRMSRFEPAILRAADRVLVCSDLERQLVHTWGVDGAMVVPNGVDVARYAAVVRHGRAEGEPATILFTGGLAYSPNAEGVRWFVEEVVPPLRRRLPRFRFLVVGKGAPRSLLDLAKPGEIEFTGWVDDVRPLLARADVCVVPLHVGGGTRIKILEAMAAGVPVVSTRIGAEGIPARDGVSIRLADFPEDMAREIAELVVFPSTADETAARARELVSSRYDWSEVTRPLLDYYRDL